jgi:hypothetical protein
LEWAEQGVFDLVSAQVAVHEWIDAVTEHSEFGDKVRSLLYFHVVRLAPRKLHREHVDGEVGFDLNDMVIAPHRVLHIDAERRRVVVEVSSLDYTTSISTQPFVLSLATFSPEQLLDLRQWQMEDELMYNIWDCVVLERLPLAPRECTVYARSHQGFAGEAFGEWGKL